MKLFDDPRRQVAAQRDILVAEDRAAEHAIANEVHVLLIATMLRPILCSVSRTFSLKLPVTMVENSASPRYCNSCSPARSMNCQK